MLRSSLEQRCCDKKLEVQKDKRGLCGVGVVIPPLGCPLKVDHRSHLNFAKNHRGD